MGEEKQESGMDSLQLSSASLFYWQTHKSTNVCKEAKERSTQVCQML